MNPPLDYTCPYPPCGQPVGAHCRTKAGRIVKPHKGRVEVAEAVMRGRAASEAEQAAKAEPPPPEPRPVLVIATVIDSANNVRCRTFEANDAEQRARLWATRQTDVDFARYFIDGREFIGWPTSPHSIEWKEPQPA